MPNKDEDNPKLPYSAFLAKIPGIKPATHQYKLFVREKQTYSQQKIVYDEVLSELPSSASLNYDSLWIYEPGKKEIRIVSFDWDDEQGYTRSVTKRSIKLPERVEVKHEPSLYEAERRTLAQNLQ